MELQPDNDIRYAVLRVSIPVTTHSASQTELIGMIVSTLIVQILLTAPRGTTGSLRHILSQLVEATFETVSRELRILLGELSLNCS